MAGAFQTKEKHIRNLSLRQNKYTIHPELLDKSGNITDEELLTVRFSNDNDSHSKKRVHKLINQIKI